jgi:RNA polymerase sigma-70 factor (ECF subfamily)
MDDAAILERIRAGDEHAFADLVRRDAGRLLAVTRRILNNEDDAREAVHEAFIAAYRARDQFQAASRLSTWLHRIAINTALMKLRARKRRPEEAIDDLLPRFLPDGHHVERFRAWTEPADVAIARRETAALVQTTIQRLPESLRTVLILRDIEGLSTDETAALVGTTPNAVKIRLHRARLALRTLLAPHFEGAAS